MNIYLMIVLLALAEIPTLPECARANTRTQRDRQIARNKALESSRFRCGIWFGKPYHNEIHDRVKHLEWEGKYVSYHGGHIYDKKQDGRFAEFNFGGHRRFAKWAREYYPSGADYFGKLRWDEELKEYLES